MAAPRGTQTTAQNKPQSSWVGSPNFEQGREGHKVDRIVMHWMEGTLAGTDSIFQDRGHSTSAHFGIEDNQIHQYVREEDTAWHSGNKDMNHRSIGIEHSASTTRPASQGTIDTSAHLLAYLAKKYSIPLERSAIIKHNEVVSTSCPGTLPVDAIINKARTLNGDSPLTNSGQDPSSGSGGSGFDLADVEKVAKAGAFAAYLEAPGLMDQFASTTLKGDRSLLNDQPLLPFVQQLCKASLRSFQSLPNGSFYAFYPDYFGGLGHRTPYWEISDIEIIDGKINLSDDALATHVYVTGDNAGYYDGVTLEDKIRTAGVITIFNAFLADFINHNIFRSQVSGLKSGGDAKDHKDWKFDPKKFANDPNFRSLAAKDKAIEFIRRYGARPLSLEMPMVRSPYYEAFLAYQTFCLMWARQFVTTFHLTFMPELYPGGIVAFPDHGIQCFIDEVTHVFDLETGFQTQVNLSAPASLPSASRQNVHAGMIRAFAISNERNP